jgi:hypothetical protein
MNEVDPTQLFLLAELASTGPAQKPHLRRAARVACVLPSGHLPVRLGLRRLEQSGLITATRDKPGGWLSARVVYALTNEGSRELDSLREMLLAHELTAEHPGPSGTRSPLRWWVKARRAFNSWLEMPLARRSGELR